MGGCTVMICGRDTTVDGSILFVKTEDDGGREVDYLWHIPRKTWPDGAVVRLQSGGTIPQVRETYAYFFDECPGTAFSNGLVNEWGVAFGSNGCSSREDSIQDVEARGDLTEGGLGFMLRFILAQRSRTAREAVELASRLLDRYGYRGSGRSLNIVGPGQAWQLQLVRGRQYVARRVRDEEVAIIANTFSIRDVDPSDRDNFICSPELIDYAVRRGWYDPESGEPFDFAAAYAPEKSHTAPSNTHRQWVLAKQLNRYFPYSWKESEQGVMPVSVKPDRKLSLQDVMAIFRNHYEGTGLDKYQKIHQSPHKTPATICNYGTHRTTVIQQRDWLPPEIGTVVWRALDQPCSSVFSPWYLGAVEIPEEMHKAPENLHTSQRDLLDFHFNPPRETWDLGLDSASGVFTLLGEMVDADYREAIEEVRETWRAFEERAFLLQPAIEKTAAELYQRDRNLGAEFLSLYSSGQALRALETARGLINRIKRTHWGTHRK